MVAASWRTPLLILSRPCNRYQCQWQRRELSSSSSSSVASSSNNSGVTRAGSSGNNAITSSSCIYEDEQLGLRTEDLPLPVWKVMQQLRAAGHTVLLVGGAVRDLLLSSPPKDYDLLTSAHLAEVKHLMHKPRVFGRTVPICQLDLDGVRIEISSIHTRPPVRLSTAAGAAGDLTGAGVPPDAAQILQAGPQAAAAAAAAVAAASTGQIGRHRRAKATFLPGPQQQQQQQLSWAAARRANALGRDFTVNCLLYDPFAGLLFDYAGGVADIQGRVLRCNGDAAERFSRDPACMLRAVRCAARAGLDVEPHTLAALQQHGHLIRDLNSHRLTAELLSMLGYGAAAPSLQLLEQTQLLQHLLPLHAVYMRRQQQQSRQHCNNSVPKFVTSTTTAGRSEQPSSSSSQSCEDDGFEWQQLQQVSSQTQAYSALGQLWSRLHGIKPVCGVHQQQQQQLQVLQDQHQQLQHANLLLRVLAALDQHTSVSQPAQAEVVLTCLTVPLLVEELTAATVQLQRHVQQQARHQEAARRHEQQQLQAEQQQHEPLHVLAAASGYSSAAADRYTLLLHPLPAARSIARPFSSAAAALSDSVISCITGPEVDSQVQQLLQGMPPAEFMQQHTVRLAAKVCRQPLQEQSLQDEQHGYQADTSSQLFGTHAPNQVADLLMACIQPSKQQTSTPSQSQQSQQQQQCTGGSMRRSSSNRQQSNAQPHLWDEYAAALPRSNKQFRQLMQRQWDRQLQGAPDGYVGTLATDAGLLAAAEAGRGSSYSSRKRLNDWAGSIDDQGSCKRDDGAAEQLVQQVLQAAGVDLCGLQEQLQLLQGQCLQLQQ